MDEIAPLPPADDGTADAGDKGDAKGQASVRRLREELSRLRLKLEHSSDKDIRAVLQMRIDQITSELPAESTKSEQAFMPPQSPVAEVISQEEPEENAPVAELTADQLKEVDRLISQARVEKMRNNAGEATRLLQQAANLAPSSASVLEALGDNLIERRQLVPAIKAYKKARRLAPKNVGLEEKLANAVLRADTGGSIDQQLRSGMSDSPFLTNQDIIARTPYAVILSVFVPGAGHLALGKTTAGVSLLLTWIVCWIWLLIKEKDVEGLAKMIAGRTVHTDTGVYIPIFIMVVCWLGALASLKPRTAAGAKRHIDHPVPPANLPFE